MEDEIVRHGHYQLRRRVRRTTLAGCSKVPRCTRADIPSGATFHAAVPILNNDPCLQNSTRGFGKFYESREDFPHLSPDKRQRSAIMGEQRITVSHKHHTASALRFADAVLRDYLDANYRLGSARNRLP